MIDFPATPVTGQTFAASNGVTYQWTGTAWITAGQTVAGGGDFCATNPATFNPSTAGAAVAGILTTIISGNAGGHFNPTTGRFTPPAGRYCVWAAAKFHTNSAAALGSVWLYKNGVRLGLDGGMTTAGATYSGFGASQVLVDANGTDYFEMWAYGQSGGGNQIAATNAVFGAYPISGIKGPPGDVGTAATGEFFARNSVNMTAPTTAVVIKPDTIVTGNSGGWYNPATGRYTPPAGRYYIAFHSTYMSSNSASTGYYSLAKNGVTVATEYGVANNTSYHDSCGLSGIFDANGTDYFEILQGGGVAGTIPAGMCLFSAFPLAGLRGPQGAPGVNGTDGAPGTPGAGGDLPVGSVIDFAGVTAPTGWLLCNGQLVSRTIYSALFAAIGTLYGAGDGTTFGIPDCRGRVTAGHDGGSGRLTGVVAAAVGSVGGDQNLHAHAHGPGNLSTAGHGHGGSYGTVDVGNNVYNGTSRVVGTADGTNSGPYGYVTVNVAAVGALAVNAGATANAGAGGSLNVQPTIIMNKIIRA